MCSRGSGYDSVWLSWTRSWTFWFHRRRGISFPAELRWGSPGVLWFVVNLREFGRLCWLFTSLSGLWEAHTILEIDYYLPLSVQSVAVCHTRLSVLVWLVLKFVPSFICNCGSGRVVGIATGYGLDGPGIESRCGRDFPHLSTPALDPTQPPVQGVPGLSQGQRAAWAWR